ncbi:hypothetical protein THRCLA_00365 [Thraustotheca clavata]|uniref:Uncharacterized protein n=1 Tax=Thraustotheca clavata TaxID=74557 RepID=A0A1W0AC87_9STRA|nr:hypothetical protein THRCLA_00365 [Thraustotheca clavata]
MTIAVKNTSVPATVPISTEVPTTLPPTTAPPTTAPPATTTPAPTTTSPPTTTPIPTTTAAPTTIPPPTTPIPTTITPKPTIATPEPTTATPTTTVIPTTLRTTTAPVSTNAEDDKSLTYALIGGGCGVALILVVTVSYCLAKGRQRISDVELKPGISPLDTFRTNYNVVTMSGRLTAHYDLDPFGNPAYDVVEPPPPLNHGQPALVYSMPAYDYPTPDHQLDSTSSFSGESGYSHIPSFQTDADIFDSQYSLKSTADVPYWSDSFSDTSSEYRSSQSYEI